MVMTARILPRLPARVEAGAGIAATLSSGVLRVALSYDNISSDTPADTDSIALQAAAGGAFKGMTYGAFKAPIVNESITSATAAAVTEVQAALTAAIPVRGYMWGLTISNNASDATNDIDIASGPARDSTNAITIVLASGMTKRLDANWEPGSGNGGRYSGAVITDTTYHVWLIAKALGASPDIYLHPSAVATTVISQLQGEPNGADYIYARRIGSILRVSGTILSFRQDGDRFTLTNSVIDRSSTSGASNALVSLTVPTGIAVRPMLRFYLQSSDTTSRLIYFFTGHGTSSTAGYEVAVLYSTAVCAVLSFVDFIYTNTSGQIRLTQTNTTGTPSSSIVLTLGWIDPRGRE